MQHRLGRWLFRHRSWTPLPLIFAVAAYALWPAPTGVPSTVSAPSGGGLETPALEILPAMLSAALVAAGCGLRLAVAGRAPAGTSGRGRRLEARQLVTWGAYAWTRNPLYLGNLLICLGLGLEIRSVLAASSVLLFFYLQYSRVIRAEEAFLEARFGAEYAAWAARVPRFWPRRPQLPGPPPPPIRWRQAVVRDADTWFAALAGWTFWAWWAHLPIPGGRDATGVGLALLVIGYAGIKGVKRLKRRITA